MRIGPCSNPLVFLLKGLGTSVICAYMSFPLLPFQGRFWKETEIALCALFLMLAVTSSKSKPLFQFQDWPCWIFLLGLAAGLVAPVDHVVANQRYRELFVTMLSLYYIGKALARSEQDRLMLITLLCVLSSATALYAIWYFFRHAEFSLFFKDLPSSLAYRQFREEYTRNFHPTILGNYLALSPCFALSLLARGSPTLKALGLVTLVLGSLVLLIPYWRGAPYVFGISVCCFLLLKRRYTALSVTMSTFALILSLGLLSPSPSLKYDIRIILFGQSGFLSPRRTMTMGASWLMWKDSPLVGVGFDHYWTVFDKYNILYQRLTHPSRAKLTGADFEHYWRLNRPKPGKSARRHDLSVADNMYCTLLAETGLVDVMGFLVFVFAMLRRGFNGLRRAADPYRRTCLITALSVFVGLLASMTGYELFYWRTPFMLFGLASGLISALSRTASVEG